jgi:hypothetical protein
MNLSIDARAVAVMGPDVSGERTTSKNGCSKTSASRWCTSAKGEGPRSQRDHIMRVNGPVAVTLDLTEFHFQSHERPHEPPCSCIGLSTCFREVMASEGCRKCRSCCVASGVTAATVWNVWEGAVGRCCPPLILPHCRRDSQYLGINEVRWLNT